jgi:hypothetical protein
MATEADLISPELASHLELHEAEAWEDFHRAAPGEMATAAGIRAVRLRSGVVGMTASVDVLAFNRVVSLGFGGEVDESLIDETIALFQEQNVPRFFVQVCPLAQPAALPQWLRQRGFQHYNNWVKLYRDAQPMDPVKTDLRVEQIGSEMGDVFADILVTSFEWSPDLKPWVAASVGRDGWRHYLAFDGNTPMATAAVYCRGEYGWIDFASTLPGYRGRGGQAALLERRIADSAELGCKWLVVETAEETPEKPAPSYRNMRRYGFDVAYVRPNYLYQFGQ